MALKPLKFKIVGVASALIMHNGDLANPLGKFAKAIKAISAKRKKTDADFEQMAKLEFFGSLYMKDGVPVIPAFVVEATIISGAKKAKRGNDAKAGIFCMADAVLEYEGPKGVEELWADERFRIQCGVRVGQARVIRTRPKFDKWSIVVELTYDDQILNEADVRDFLIKAGAEVGFCDWRPKHGRFHVEQKAA